MRKCGSAWPGGGKPRLRLWSSGEREDREGTQRRKSKKARSEDNTPEDVVLAGASARVKRDGGG